MHRHDAHVGGRFTRRIEQLAGDDRALLEVQSELGCLARAHLHGLSAPRLDERRETGLLHVDAVAPGRQPVEDEAAMLVAERLRRDPHRLRRAGAGHEHDRRAGAGVFAPSTRHLPRDPPVVAAGVVGAAWLIDNASHRPPRTATPACIEHLRDLPH